MYNRLLTKEKPQILLWGGFLIAKYEGSERKSQVKIDKILENKQLTNNNCTTVATTTVNKYINTAVTVVNNNTNVKYLSTDKLIEDCSDLINPTFKSWYCKRFYALGVARVLELASIARSDGKNAPRLFSTLVKEG